jgi:hypothetical protein
MRIAWKCRVDMKHGHAARTCHMHMQQGHANWTCSTDMQHGQEAWTGSMGMQYGHASGTCCMGRKHGHAPWTGSMDTKRRNSERTCTRDMHSPYSRLFRSPFRMDLGSGPGIGKERKKRESSINARAPTSFE